MNNIEKENIVVDNRSDNEKLNDLLNVYKIQHLKNFIDLKKYFDIEILDSDKSPKITCDKKTCIIFDNITFNETYLLDIFNEIISDKNNEIIGRKLETEINFVYVDDFLIKTQLFTNRIDEYQKEINISKEKDLKFEKERLIPGFMLINPKTNEISFFKEFILSIFDKKSILNILSLTNFIK